MTVETELMAHRAGTIAPLPSPKDAGRRVNPLRSLWFAHPASRPVDSPPCLRPSVGRVRPGAAPPDRPREARGALTPEEIGSLGSRRSDF
ncbi:hypothetical protein EYF80_056937 [Liparis tanakae]|uniref:Uncharacterized protein n=1 Tax=Liparis tanakae TaxID=230148 RepID=A0A4Z2EW76_9TELE|nr:hypothetical protein EYF80_056937 [Liparis tanakae]